MKITNRLAYLWTKTMRHADTQAVSLGFKVLFQSIYFIRKVKDSYFNWIFTQKKLT